ncbi:copper chaperone PCu(A)C [Jannaschia sp. 2305UL9-9]|uniref:copper chaperone PCu(A)C n=1 Tax=Jannaschia sp. 2305UL9-9 TaxID=3121638 RepID=UPI003527ECB7
MRNLLAATALAVFSTATLTAPIWAERAGDLEISKTMLRATPPGAPVAGGYVMIENTGATDDTLVSASIDLETVGRVELHEMRMADGVMSMSEVDGGIAIPAGETVVLQPGGLHLMLMGLTGPLVPGETHQVTLTFAQSGEVTMDFPVMTLGDVRDAFEGAGAMDHGGHGEDHGDGHTADAHSGHGD